MHNVKRRWQQRLFEAVQQSPLIRALLLPASVLFAGLVCLRRCYYQLRTPAWQHKARILVVGNINVGGSGKSPCVQCLAIALQQRGWRVGIVSRGYGARRAHKQPRLVNPEQAPELFGEEASWLARTSGAPVVVCQRRRLAAEELLRHYQLDIIISDDGLQHYALPRHIECVLLPAVRIAQHPQLLPAGELREPLSRLRRADLLIDNALTAEPSAAYYSQWDLPPIYPLQLASITLVSLGTGAELDLSTWRQQHQQRQLHLCCGIAQPQRFKASLQAWLGEFACIEHYYPDHHLFEQQDFVGFADALIIMTEKDALKCQQLQLSQAWFVRLSARLPEQFYQDLQRLLTTRANER